MLKLNRHAWLIKYASKYKVDLLFIYLTTRQVLMVNYLYSRDLNSKPQVCYSYL